MQIIQNHYTDVFLYDKHEYCAERFQIVHDRDYHKQLNNIRLNETGALGCEEGYMGLKLNDNFVLIFIQYFLQQKTHKSLKNASLVT